MTDLNFDRYLALDGAHNIRDLGGLPRRQGGETRPGRAFRGCGMDGLSAAGQAALCGMGFARIIDLRTPYEIADNPGPFRDHPQRRELSLFEGLAPVALVMQRDPAADLADRYIGALDARPEQFAEVFRLLAEVAGEGPVLFHCTAGKDRTGVIAALLLALNGVAEDQIALDYAATATLGAGLLSRLRTRALAGGADPALVERVLEADAAAMRRVLGWIEAGYGSAAGYLAAAGLGADDLARVQGLL